MATPSSGASPPPGATVFLDLGKSLRRLVRSRIQELRKPDAVVFESPGSIDPGNETKLTIFLYQVRPNRYLWNESPSIRRDRQGDFRSHSSVPLELFYMFVPYAQHAETQLVLADRLQRLFYDEPVLEGDQLVGSLPATGNQRLSVIPQDLSTDAVHNIWSGFSFKPYQLSLFFLLTPVLLPSSKHEKVPMVTEVETTYHVTESSGTATPDLSESRESESSP